MAATSLHAFMFAAGLMRIALVRWSLKRRPNAHRLSCCILFLLACGRSKMSHRLCMLSSASRHGCSNVSCTAERTDERVLRRTERRIGRRRNQTDSVHLVSPSTNDSLYSRQFGRPATFRTRQIYLQPVRRQPPPVSSKLLNNNMRSTFATACGTETRARRSRQP